MNIPAVWKTEIEALDEFDEQASTRPGSLILQADRSTMRGGLTFASLLEERSIFWVNGPGWRAEIRRKKKRELAEEYREWHRDYPPSRYGHLKFRPRKFVIVPTR